MFRCRSCESVFASVMSSSTKRLSDDRCGRIFLIATGFSNPPPAVALPRKISAIPPTPIRSTSSYRAIQVHRTARQDTANQRTMVRMRALEPILLAAVQGGVTPGGVVAVGAGDAVELL